MTGVSFSGRLTRWWEGIHGGQPLPVLGALLVALVVMGTLALILWGSGETQAETAPSNPPEAPTVTEICIDKWNSAGGSGKELAGNLTQGPRGERTVYAAAGASADIPDRCLITLAEPDYGYAFQFNEQSDGSFMVLAWTPPPRRHLAD